MNYQTLRRVLPFPQSLRKHLGQDRRHSEHIGHDEDSDTLVTDDFENPDHALHTAPDPTCRTSPELEKPDAIDLGLHLLDGKLGDVEIKFPELSESSYQGVFVTRNGRLVYANKRLADMTGRSLDQILGQSLEDYMKDVIHPDSHEVIQSKFAARLNGYKGLQRYEVKVVAKPDDVRWVEILSQPAVLDGALIIKGLVLDITARKNAEEALRESEERYRAVFDNSPIGISLSDKDGRYRYVNAAYCRIYGYSADELVGRRYMDLIVTPELRSDPTRNYEKYFKAGLPTPLGETEFVRKNGERVWIEYTGDFVWADGKPKYLVSMNVDITERKRAEAALRESEKRYKIVSELTSDFIATIRVKDDGDFELESISAGFFNFSGYTFDDIRESGRWTEAVLAEDLEGLMSLLRSVAESGQPGKVEFRIMTKARETRWLRAYGRAVIAENGSINNLIAAAQDITDRKRTDEILCAQRDFTVALGSSSTLEHALDVCLDYVIKISGMDSCAIFFVNGRGGLDLAAHKGFSNESVLNILHFEPHSPQARMATRGKPVYDLFDSWLSPLSGIAKQEKLRAAGLVPIRHEGQVIAVFAAASHSVDRLVSSARNTLEMTTTHIGSVIGRLKTEHALRKLEESYRNVVENANEAILVIQDANIKYGNPKAIELSGYTLEEVSTRPFTDFIHPDDREIVGDYYTRRIAGREAPRRYSFRVVRKDGVVRWLDANVATVSWNGRVAALGFLSDITEEMDVLQALRESEAKYRLLIDNAGQPIFSISSDGSFLTMNRAAADYLGGKPEDFVGKRMSDLFPEEIAARQMNNVRKAITLGTRMTTTEPTVFRGEERWFNTNVQPVLSPGNKMPSALLIATDITELKQREIKEKARSQLLDDLRRARKVDDCLQYCCQALYAAKLFKRSVLTLHNKKRRIIHVGHVGLDPKQVKAALKASPPSVDLAKRWTQEKYRISHSYFIPAEENLIDESLARRIAQSEASVEIDYAWQAGDELFIPLRGPHAVPEGWLSVDTPFSGKRPTLPQVVYLEELVEITAKKVHEIQSLEMLRKEHEALEQKNAALNELLARIELEKHEIRRQMADEIENSLLPALRKSIRRDGRVNRAYFDTVLNALQSMAATAGGIQHLYDRLSPREVEICDLIRSGITSKDIADSLDLSLRTVQKHREASRKKLGLSGKKVNLTTYLRNLK